jgi:phosphoketolase
MAGDGITDAPALRYDLNMIYVSGPGHGGAAIVGNTHLEVPLLLQFKPF